MSVCVLLMFCLMVEMANSPVPIEFDDKAFKPYIGIESSFFIGHINIHLDRLIALVNPDGPNSCTGINMSFTMMFFIWSSDRSE